MSFLEDKRDIQSYSGKLKDKDCPHYRSVYTDPSTNATEYVAVTQFQATDARRAFPCFDEPGIKVQFQMVIC